MNSNSSLRFQLRAAALALKGQRDEAAANYRKVLEFPARTSGIVDHFVIRASNAYETGI